MVLRGDGMAPWSTEYLHLNYLSFYPTAEGILLRSRHPSRQSVLGRSFIQIRHRFVNVRGHIALCPSVESIARALNWLRGIHVQNDRPVHATGRLFLDGGHSFCYPSNSPPSHVHTQKYLPQEPCPQQGSRSLEQIPEQHFATVFSGGS